MGKRFVHCIGLSLAFRIEQWIPGLRKLGASLPYPEHGRIFLPVDALQLVYSPSIVNHLSYPHYHVLVTCCLLCRIHCPIKLLLPLPTIPIQRP
jgi:hypothetical protein